MGAPVESIIEAQLCSLTHIHGDISEKILKTDFEDHKT